MVGPESLLFTQRWLLLMSGELILLEERHDPSPESTLTLPDHRERLALRLSNGPHVVFSEIPVPTEHIGSIFPWGHNVNIPLPGGLDTRLSLKILKISKDFQSSLIATRSATAMELIDKQVDRDGELVLYLG